jgi:hypothetical protein
LNNDKPCILVELVGLACSGKSSLKAAIEHQVKSRLPGLDDVEKSQSGPAPSLFYSSLAWGRLIARQAFSLRSLSVWMDVVRTLRRLRSSTVRGGIHVVDEGLLHKFRSVRRLSRSTITLKDVVGKGEGDRLFPIPSDIVVCVNVSPAVYAERLAKRDAKIVDMARAERAVDHMKFTYDDIQAFIAMYQQAEVICVDNTGSDALENNARMIADKIAAIYDNKTGRSVH